MLSVDMKRRIMELLKQQIDIGSEPVWKSLGSGVGGVRWCVECDDRKWFVKVIDDQALAAAEAEGLAALADCGAVRVPEVIGVTGTDSETCLVMEWLELVHGTEIAAMYLGEQLAQQHRRTGAQFGWHAANFIGPTRQFNNFNDDWLTFFREQRLGFQLRLALENGYRGGLQKQGARLMEKLPFYFDGYAPQPSLLHGDLWGGNWGVLADGEPVLFDPAVYYGDREADIAMTELFGGFPAVFYHAYDTAYPRDAGYRIRRDLYNLYHVLNHLNLFGSAYLNHAERLMQHLLSKAN